MDLETLLFEESLAKGQKPLFASQVDLAGAVKSAKEGGFDRADKTLNSIRTFINQVLNLNRPISPNLRRAIVAAVADRVADEAALPALLHDLEVAFTTLEKQRRARRIPLDDAEEFDALETASEKASVHFIVTDRPAEITPTAKAIRLTRQLVGNLHLVGPARSNGLGDAARYMFHFPDRSYAIQFWGKLETFLVDHLRKSRKHIEARLKRVEETGHLEVYELSPSFLVVFPCVVFDPESDEDRAGFILFYHEGNRVSVAKMPPLVLKKWHDEIYLKICTGSQPFRRERIRYQEYLEFRDEER